MRGRTRSKYSKERRAAILAAAAKEGLTAKEVEKRFGVVPVTYYLWRRKAKAGGSAKAGVGKATSAARLRQAVRAKLARQLPRIVDQEVKRYLRRALGGR